MSRWYVRTGSFIRHLWRGSLGIAAELVLVAIFIAAGLAVCLVWWWGGLILR